MQFSWKGKCWVATYSLSKVWHKVVAYHQTSLSEVCFCNDFVGISDSSENVQKLIDIVYKY